MDIKIVSFIMKNTGYCIEGKAMDKIYHFQDGDLFQQMPKIELHRHLEGALRLETLLELAKDNGSAISDPTLFEKSIKI